MALQEIIRNVQRRSRSDESEDSGKSEYDFSKPFRVKIVSDCRDVEEKLNGQWGNCLGQFDSGIEDIGENPLIETDTGERIWGYECWWASEEAIRSNERYEKILNLHWRCYGDPNKPFDETESRLLARYYDSKFTHEMMTKYNGWGVTFLNILGANIIKPPVRVETIYSLLLLEMVRSQDEASYKLMDYLEPQLIKAFDSDEELRIRVVERKFFGEGTVARRLVRREIGELEYNQLCDGTHPIYKVADRVVPK
jgi:hypothetical protein